MQDSTTSDHFPFLNLPSELRLMIYEHLSITTRHHTLSFKTKFSRYLKPTMLSVTLVTRTLPVPLLRTCKQIHSEASPTLSNPLSKLKKEPIKFIIDVEQFKYCDEFVSMPNPVFDSAPDEPLGKHILRLWGIAVRLEDRSSSGEAYKVWSRFKSSERSPEIRVFIAGRSGRVNIIYIPLLLESLDRALRRPVPFYGCKVSVASEILDAIYEKVDVERYGYIKLLEGAIGIAWSLGRVGAMLEPTAEEWEEGWEEGERCLGNVDTKS
ncbi:hypothetical protein BDV96DRAFT_649538 [Lophiotrema nucula]|uniref:2EXR domain-containing protein n=1 Tax=Lophiotrema nucula TaxID=690887 RepID=A0A6A5YYA2_9PLEO|nr:hypothetical protein BDV96DRAFT_649538 [Lophiotrema nucula]